MQPVFLLFLTSCLLLTSLRTAGQSRCGAVEARQRVVDSDPDEWQAGKLKTEEVIQNWILDDGQRVELRSLVTIPVVVHIVYHTAAENISDAQIFSQLDILNQDYRSLNAEINSIPGVFQNLIADVEFEFCLAAVDPEGNPTTGITRTFTSNPVGIGGTSNIHYTAQGGHDAWDPNRYLNIWVAKFAGGIGGVSSFPGVGLPAEDGVEINYLQFGNINVEPPYHLGRTLTHEIGHYFNLEHPWGPALDDCCEDDFVLDTPESCETYIGECPTHPVISCSQPDLFMNFMFYTNDACLGMFTNGQKIRMLATLNTLRSGLLSGNVCESVAVTESAAGFRIETHPNPAHNELEFVVPLSAPINGQVKLFDLTGKLLHQGKIERTGRQVIDLRGYTKGLYLLTVETENERVVNKVVVQ